MVNGILTLDGTITADGEDGASYSFGSRGGGSGGSVWLMASQFTGDVTGTITADGGAGGNRFERGSEHEL